MTSSAAQNQRDALFDNIRCLLIFLVLLCHMLSSHLGVAIGKQPDAVQLFYRTTFLFHMPGFLVISGFFSKNAEKSRDTAVAKFLLPYLVFNLISSLIYLIDKGIAWYKLDIFYPRWGIWFFLTMFIWKFLLKDIIQIRFALPLSFLIGLGAGFFDKLDSDLALGRAFSFLPFFLLGYYLKKEHIEKIRKLPKWIPILTLILSLAFAAFSYFNYREQWTAFLNFEYQTYFMRGSYHSNGLSLSNGVITRAFMYLFSLLAVFSMIALMPRKKTCLSAIGQNTLPVYILHLYVLQFIKPLKLFGGSGWDYVVYSILVCIALLFLLSSKPVVKVYNATFQWIERILFSPSKTKS